ncbi:Hypothetical predicted protein [Paramuricea clavata]|uniref:Uncharacterized protein n=1 Tax=Paramuricea clavata TaxID=317549 RepID=A0A6S7HKE5_PARCT|nr:Hypothetical predicted protein [Paramuricea clavata]
MILRPNLDFAVNFHTFKIYVSETDSFPVDLEYTTPEYTGTGNFVNLIPFDYHQNSYFRSLAACYIATFKSGISENHLNNTLSDSHLITSIVKFHVHYQMEKFMKDSRLMDHYLNEDDLYVLGKYMPTTETWERRTLSSHANIGTWYYGLPADTQQKIRNQHYVQPTSPENHPGTSPAKHPATSSVKNPASPVKHPATSPVKNPQLTFYGNNKMSILLGYDYFDEFEDMKKKVTEIEKKQQDNTADIQKNKTELVDLSEVGRNPPVQIDLVQKVGLPP